MTIAMTEMKLLHRALTAVGVIVGAGVIVAAYQADRLVRVGAGYKAKIACSEIFVAKRDPKAVIANEFGDMAPAMDKVRLKVLPKQAAVRARGPFGIGGVQAIYRPGLGCTLVNAGRVINPAALQAASALSEESATPWPEAPPVSGKALERVDYGALEFALARAFEDNETVHRSVLIAVDGKIVDERYADGFNQDTPFLSWSMAKSVTATLVGAAQFHGVLNVEDHAPVPEWAGDENRAAITWNNLLHMQSGLAFGEDYDDPRSDVNRMLFERADSGAVAARNHLEHAPGAFWHYSSGTSNLIARSLKQTLEGGGLEFYSFARDTVLGPLGATSFVLEPDATGTFVGSSFVYATARDWARLGQLYLQDGVWSGQRLLPEGWTDYVRAPAKHADGQYGAHFWLNHDGEQGRVRFIPGLPEDVYYMAGHEGQYVVMIPDKRMVIVRTGLTRGEVPIDVVAPLFKQIYDAVGYSSDRGAAAQ